MNEEKRKQAIKRYLADKGIKPSSRGYKALFYAILEASCEPDKPCMELFDVAARAMSSESSNQFSGDRAYRNANYAIKNSKNGSYEGGLYEFIKSCSIELESM